MDRWERMGYESKGDYARDRFYDEVLDRPKEVCGECPEWTRCTVKGHESVGWCSRWAYFFEEDDERCE